MACCHATTRQLLAERWGSAAVWYFSIAFLGRTSRQGLRPSRQGLQALVLKPTSGPLPTNWKPYLEKLPNDPWGRPYQYLNPGIKGEVDVMSFGADGQSGGEGKDADIGSWQ